MTKTHSDAATTSVEPNSQKPDSQKPLPLPQGQVQPLLSPDEIRKAGTSIKQLLDGLGQALLGQQELLEMVTICLLAKGHLLLEGLPGLGKTELVKALSVLLGLDFKRIQFTPDLLPSDIIGAPILEESEQGRQLVFHRGPVFANLVLADEINRATPKTQSALLEAMSEQSVTVMGHSHRLPQPFFVLATQNPIELEGTYSLPEAQLDRFTMKIDVAGVSANTLEQILLTRHNGQPPTLTETLSVSEWTELLDYSAAIHLPQAVANYIARLVTATHPTAQEAPEEVRRFVRFGGSPRAAIALAGTARAAALLAGKPNVGFDDVRRVAAAVLGHRLLLDYSARLEEWTPTRLIEKLLETVPELSRALPADITTADIAATNSTTANTTTSEQNGKN